MMKHLKLLGVIIGMIVWLAACSIDLSEPSHKPPEPIIVTETPGADQAIGSGTAATPPAWANLNLSGHLIFVQIPRQIVKLDLASGARTVLFEAPGNGFVSAAQVSRNGQWIVMAYAPPKDPSLQSVNTDLYVMPADGSTPPKYCCNAPMTRKITSIRSGRRMGTTCIIRILCPIPPAAASTRISDTIWSGWLIRTDSRKN